MSALLAVIAVMACIICFDAGYRVGHSVGQQTVRIVMVEKKAGEEPAAFGGE